MSLLRRVILGCALAMLVTGLVVETGAAQDGGQGASQADVIVHVVQRGETLFRIAQRFGTTVEAIATFNGILDPTNIQIGQRLLIPSGIVELPGPAVHVVQPGETLRTIAELYDLTLEAIADLNQIVDIDRISVGQELVIRPEAAQPTQPPLVAVAPTSVPRAVVYTVQPGDTLFRIATRFGQTVNELAVANNLVDPTLIYTGQQLIIPGLEPPQLALDLPVFVSTLDITPLVFVEGESARIRLTTTQPLTVSGSFLGRNIPATANPGESRYTLLIGIPIFTEAGVYPLSLRLADAQGAVVDTSIFIQVVDGAYGRESINLIDGRTGLLDPAVEKAEADLINGVVSGVNPDRYFNGPMGLPAAAAVTSPFGRKRSFNGGPFDRYHSGTDFGGAPGTPVLATAPGYVVLADTLNVRGRATVIDHGWGVYTGYWHQTDQFVSVGDFVNTGDVIGTVGSTGRVSGPHLHWELWVHGVPVNPMQWVQMRFD